MKTLRFEPLTKASWPDLERLFGEKGACGGCWCMYWRLEHRTYEANKGENNKRALRQRVDNHHPLGVIAFDGTIPVGWCSLSPRADLIRLENSRTLKPLDNIDVWTISCLFVYRPYRKQNISTALVAAATRYAFEQGAPAVEAYPVVPKKHKIPDVFAFPGLVRAFTKAGFEVVQSVSTSRVIVRIYP